MTRRRAVPWDTVLVVVLTVSGVAAWAGPTAGAQGPVTSIPPNVAKAPIYLDLGDSVGVWNGNRSYPNVLAAHLQKDVPHLALVNMACSGETTDSMMSGSTCAPGGSQLKNAVDFLRAHQGQIALITIDIGGNDVVGCVYAPDQNACLTRRLVGMKEHLSYILDALRLAVGWNVPIVGMNVFDPLLGDWLGSKADRAVALATITGVATLDQAMDMDYGVAASPVADVQDAFSARDMTDFVASKWGRVPVAVARACTLLDIVCHKGQGELIGDDPDGAGAKVIAQAFEKAIGTLQPPQ